MEGYENYFENFTLQNKSSNVEDDLKKTITLINKVDSQRFELNKRVVELNSLLEDLPPGTLPFLFRNQQFLPEYVNRGLESLQRMTQEQNKLGLSYK